MFLNLPLQGPVQFDLGLLLLTGTFAAMIVMPLYLLGHLEEGSMPIRPAPAGYASSASRIG
jgi:hypothetical protein